MSFNVLVIPEDPVLNGYILKPLVRAVLDDVGKPKAKIKLLAEPRVRGYHDAVKTIRHSLDQDFGYYDLWLFFPDADRAKPGAMNELEQDRADRNIKLVCRPAQPEVEIYSCLAFRERLPDSWEDLRGHPRFKEDVFEPLRSSLGFKRRASGRGRESMIKQSLRNLSLLYQLCPETRRLRDRIAALVEAGGDKPGG